MKKYLIPFLAIVWLWPARAVPQPLVPVPILERAAQQLELALPASERIAALSLPQLAAELTARPENVAALQQILSVRAAQPVLYETLIDAYPELGVALETERSGVRLADFLGQPTAGSVGALPCASGMCPAVFTDLSEVFATLRLPWQERIKIAYGNLLPTGAEENLEFMATARSTDAALYFHTENAVLKLLNDEYFLDRELSNAVNNLYKKHVLEAARANPVIEQHLIAEYADYKSVRLAFDADTPVMRQALRSLDQGAISSFLLELNSRYPEVAELVEDAAHSQVRSPATWYLSGTGATADQASWSARQARYLVRPEFRPPLQRFDSANVLQRMSERRTRLCELMGELESSLGSASPLLDPGPYGPVLSTDVIDVLRKAPPAGVGGRGYIRYRIAQRHGVQLTNAQIDRIREAFQIANSFAPSIYVRNPAPMDYSPFGSQIIGLDIAHQNPRNLREVMRALRRVEATLPDGLTQSQEAAFLLAQVRMAQEAESRQFLNLRRLLANTLRSLEDGELIVSGDEVLFSPEYHLGWPSQQELLRTLGERYPGFVRMVVVNAQQGRSALLVDGEMLEKAIRLDLEGEIPTDILDQLTIGVFITGNADGATARVNLTGLGAETYRSAVHRAAERAAIPLDLDFAGVFIPPPPL